MFIDHTSLSTEKKGEGAILGLWLRHHFYSRHKSLMSEYSEEVQRDVKQ